MIWLRTHYGPLALVLIILISLWRISAMYERYSPTNDEPAHLSAGIEWWQYGTYRTEPMHPPLARMAVAALPYLNGARMEQPVICPQSFMSHYLAIEAQHGQGMYRPACADGFDPDLLYRGGNDKEQLTLARIGNVPFFILLCGVTYWLGCRLLGTPGGLIASALLASHPSILAHSALATTDISMAATSLLALAMLWRWAEAPSASRAVGVGLTGALALLAKFSSLLYLPVMALVLLSMRQWPSLRLVAVLKHGGLALLAGSALVWACYHFSLGAPADLIPFVARDYAQESWADWRIMPAPELWQGILAALQKNAKGHATYFMGEQLHNEGIWYFFPVLLFVKTPLAWWVIAVAGLWCACRMGGRLGWLPWMMAGAIMLVSLPSNINIGLRHLLVIVPWLALGTAMGFIALLQTHLAGRAAAIVLAVALVGTSWWAHPDYIPYFNILSGDDPSWITSDSDFDMMQDNGLLLETLRERGIESATICNLGMAYFRHNGYPDFRYDCPVLRPEGWFILRVAYQRAQGERLAWLAGHTPDYVVSPTIHLYHFPKKPKD